MFNFIICDNDVLLLQKLKKLIIDNEEYKTITTFKEYTNCFFKVVNDHTIKNKFYILDVETKKQNGIIVASKIRSVDCNSIIVFLTAHQEKYIHRIAKSCFRYDALISKFDDFEEELLKIIKANKKFVNKNRRITVEINSNTTCIIGLDELLYIKTDKQSQKIIFQTIKQQFSSYEPLNKFESQLNSNFIKVSRSCIVNKQFAKFDYENNIITFHNGIKLENIMSQSYIEKNLEQNSR